jgi:hypothetical protein
MHGSLGLGFGWELRWGVAPDWNVVLRWLGGRWHRCRPTEFEQRSTRTLLRASPFRRFLSFRGPNGFPTHAVERCETSGDIAQNDQREIVKHGTRSFISKGSEGRGRSASAEPGSRVDMSFSSSKLLLPNPLEKF